MVPHLPAPHADYEGRIDPIGGGTVSAGGLNGNLGQSLIISTARRASLLSRAEAEDSTWTLSGDRQGTTPFSVSWSRRHAASSSRGVPDSENSRRPNSAVDPAATADSVLKIYHSVPHPEAAVEKARTARAVSILVMI
ncbi:MAG: hypothetical protein OXC26_18250 [Albidovulum sp.]|nr:hypothetical protein [Albidovulum sp.]